MKKVASPVEVADSLTELLSPRVVGELGGQDLQGDMAAQRLLHGLVDRPHAAPAHQAEDAILP